MAHRWAPAECPSRDTCRRRYNRAQGWQSNCKAAAEEQAELLVRHSYLTSKPCQGFHQNARRYPSSS